MTPKDIPIIPPILGYIPLAYLAITNPPMPPVNPKTIKIAKN